VEPRLLHRTRVAHKHQHCLKHWNTQTPTPSKTLERTDTELSETLERTNTSIV
jgi:hypothetical protein